MFALVAMPGCSNRRSSDDVFVVGDSLTVAALTLPQEMARRGIRLHRVDAANGRTTAAGLDVLAEARSLLPEAVLVALGTNDLHTATEQEVEGWVRRARRLVGEERRLIWVNLHVEPEKDVDEPALARYTDLNRWLNAAADRHDVEVADWEEWSRAHDLDTLEDGVHYRPEGYAERARFYARVVAGDIGTS